MKKLAFVLLLIIPMVAVADRRSDFVNKILEYENTQTDNNTARINTYGVNQEKRYRELLQKRDPLHNCNISKLDRICLLCTEKTAIQCHRRLAAEYIAEILPDIEITHL